ncbi:putative peptidase E protein, partial [Corchorus olitorius]
MYLLLSQMIIDYTIKFSSPDVPLVVPDCVHGSSALIEVPVQMSYLDDASGGLCDLPLS